MPLKFMIPFRLYVSNFRALLLGEKSVTEHKSFSLFLSLLLLINSSLLRDRGLVTAKRDGRRVIYSLADDHVITLIKRVGLAHAAHQH